MILLLLIRSFNKKARRSSRRHRFPGMDRIIKGMGGALLSAVVALVATGPVLSNPEGQTVVVHGQIVNGTTAQKSRVDRLTLYEMEQSGLKTVQVLEKTGPMFQFDPIQVPQAPLLIAADIGKETFFRMLHPGDANFTLPQRIFVFDSGAQGNSVRLTSMTMFTKLKDGLFVERIYVITNRSMPPRLLEASGFRLQLPEDARDLQAYMRLEDTNLSLPVELKPTPEGYSMDRSLRPGNHTLHISFRIPGHVFQDSMPDLTTVGDTQGAISHNFRVISWKPEDAKPVVTGAEAKEIDVPDFDRAMHVTYEEGQKVRFDFGAGGYVIEKLVDEHYLPLFYRGEYALIGSLLLAIAGFLIAGLVRKRKSSETLKASSGTAL